MATLKTQLLAAGTAFPIVANGITINDVYIGDGKGSNRFREGGWNANVTEFDATLASRKSILIQPGAEVPGGYSVTNPTGNVSVVIEYWENT